ncbi:MAG: DUF4956 domain-containing protein [Vescimonas coprocola]|nr:DUF4956 domain-containing protein [Vescimonas coprocola]
MLDSILSSGLTLPTFLICTAASLILGLLTALVCMYRQRCSRGFAVTLAILPAMVQMVILLVNGNIGAGVAVAGAFSLVRFRSVPGTAREIGAIFLAMAIGLTTGMGYVALAAIFFVIVAAALVTLSRMDEEESPLKLSDFAVSEAVQETAESFRDFARSQGHPLELAIVPGLTYCGDEYAVRQLVSILLDNAVKYALPETPIRFVLEKGKRGVVLRCSNACTPLAEGETEKLFDRFYRSDQARSADGSFGVGLSIARSIAEGHHGFIRAQCPQPGEIVFTAQLR